jgi:sigma-B regulation protein RsbU (phosphoserine phosphatase)
MALGVDIGYTYREGGFIGLSEGQILLIGTDGLWETQNESGEMFGKERLKAVIRQQAGFPSEVILSAILDSLNEFRKSAKQEDDVTLTVVKVVG